MKKTLGIIGTDDLLDRVIDEMDLNFLQSVEYKKIPINHVEETLEFDIEMLGKYDLLLFAGHLAYKNYMERNYVDANEIYKQPVVIQYEGSALIKVLFELAMERKGVSHMFTPFSVDFLSDEEVKSTLTELGFAKEDFVSVQGELDYTTQEWANKHEAFYKKGKTKYAITCLTSVYKELQNRNIPAKRITPTILSIQSALEILYSKYESLAQEGPQSAVIALKWNSNKRRPNNRYDYYRAILTFQNEIIDLCEKHQMSFNFVNNHRANIFTVESTVDIITNQVSSFSFVESLKESLGNKVYAGIGIAGDISEAEKYVEKSLKFAELNKDSCTFVSYQNGDIVGPLLNDNNNSNLVFSSRSENKELLAVAEKTNLSPLTINKLVSLIEQEKSKNTTAYQLAEHFSFSLRSANRLLKKLEENDFATIVGVEQPSGRGRPRKVYNIDFPFI